MPHSDHISTYRLDGYSPRLHLSVYQPAIAASGTLTATPSNPTTALAVTFAVGDEGDVLAGMLIRIRDTATMRVKGYTRVRYYGAPSSNSIPVRELANAIVSCASGDTFEVLRYVPLDTKLVEADANFRPDGIPYASQGQNPPPLVCSGGNSVGWTDNGQAYRTITTDGSHSSTVDPDSAGDPDHFWINDSGTAFASGSANTDVSPVIEADVGHWLIQHNAFDPDTSEPVTQFTHHIVHDADHPPYDCILTDYSGDHETGNNWSVEVLDEAVTDEDIFELALCFVWTDDLFIASGAQDMHRSEVTGRSHILGMGYARRVTTAKSGEDGVERVTFEIQSPLARLSEIAGYSKVMLEDANPDAWNEMKTLGFWRGIVQLVQFYTTFVESGGDFVDNGYDDARYPAHFIQRSDPIAQIRELTDARQGRLVAREWGARLEVQTHPALLPVGSRSSIDLTLTDADVYEFEYAIELADTVETFQLDGVTAGASNNQPVFSRVSVGGGKNADAVQRKAPDDQTEANAWAGMCYAQRENVYIDASGIKHRVGELTLRCPGQYAVLDFPPDYVKFDYQGLRTDFDDYRFWLKRFNLDTDPLTGEVATVFVFQAETAAPPGVTFVPEGGSNPGSDTPSPPPLPPIVPVGLGRGTARIAILTEDDRLRRTTTFNRPAVQDGPTWDGVDLTALTGWGSGDHVTSGVQRAFFTDKLLIAGEDKVYELNSLISPSSVTDLYTFPYAWAAGDSDRFIQTERCHPTWAMVLTWDYPNAVMKVSYTIDGTTWATVSVGGAGGARERACLWMSGRTPGLARLVTFASAVSFHGDVALFQTTNFGASWSAGAVISSIGRPAIRIDCPYADESITRVTIPEYSGSGSIDLLKTYEVRGVSVTDVSNEIQYSGDSYGAQDNLALRTWDGDARRIVVIGTHNNVDPSKVGGIWTSRTGIADMANVLAPNTGNGTLYNNAWIGGDGLALYVAGYGRIFYSGDFLSSGLDERTGSGIGSARVLNLWGW